MQIRIQICLNVFFIIKLTNLKDCAVLAETCAFRVLPTSITVILVGFKMRSRNPPGVFLEFSKSPDILQQTLTITLFSMLKYEKAIMCFCLLNCKLYATEAVDIMKNPYLWWCPAQISLKCLFFAPRHEINTNLITVSSFFFNSHRTFLLSRNAAALLSSCCCFFCGT